MEISFRQGIVRYQTDTANTANFVRKNGSDPSYIDLVCDNGPTIFTLAHKSADYLVDVIKSKPQAWGPLVAHGQTQYLYWDISLLNAELTFGFTTIPPVSNTVEPVNKVIDLHWFDKTNNVMKVWNGGKWLIKLRAFAATYDNNAILIPRTKGSQVSLVGRFKSGAIVLTDAHKPLVNTDGTFITSESALLVGYSNTDLIKIESSVVYAQADGEIPAFSVVTFSSPRHITVAIPNHTAVRICGMVTSNLSNTEVGNLVTSGPVVNNNWSFDPTDINKPVYVSDVGTVSLTPSTLKIGAIGYVYDVNAIFLSIDHQSLVATTSAPNVEAGNGLTKIVNGNTATLSVTDTGVTPGTSGSPIAIPQITVDSTGRISNVAEVAIQFPAAHITLSGAVSGTVDSVGNIATTFASSGVLPGSYKTVIVDASGRVTSGSNFSTLADSGIIDVYTQSQIDFFLQNKATSATTLAGYGITDAYTITDIDTALALKSNSNHTHALDQLSNVAIINAASTQILSFNGTNWVNTDLPTSLGGSITLAGDMFGIESSIIPGQIDTTLSLSGVTPGEYTKVTVNAKGLITSATSFTTIADSGILDVYTKSEVDSLLVVSTGMDGGVF